MISDSMSTGLIAEQAEYKRGDIVSLSGGVRCVIKKRVVDLDALIVMYRVEWESGNTVWLDSDEISGRDVVGSKEPPYEW